MRKFGLFFAKVEPLVYVIVGPVWSLTPFFGVSFFGLMEERTGGGGGGAGIFGRPEEADRPEEELRLELLRRTDIIIFKDIIIFIE